MGTRYVLSIDGGGIRGILPATLLAALELQIGRPLGSVFDLVGGTSTGGIIAAAIYAGIPASRILALYIQRGGAIFARPLWRLLLSCFGLLRAKYGAGPLADELTAILRGHSLSERRFSKAELIVPTYAIRLPYPMDMDNDGVAECASALFFKSWEARASRLSDFSLVSVCRATSAAPTYFPAAKINNALGHPYLCVDGGVFANNPTMDICAAARRLWPGDELVVISLGTGTKVAAIPGSGDWGPVLWLGRIFSVFMDGAADSVSYQAAEILGRNLVRCECPLVGVNEAFDDASPRNIAELQHLAAGFSASNVARVRQALGL